MFGWLVWRDLILAWRRRSDVLATLFFFIIVTSLFPLGIGPERETLRTIAPGVVWVAALLALVLATALSATAGAFRAGAWVALAASASFAIAAGGIPGFAGTGEELAARIGLDCFGLEMLGAALAAGAVLWREGRSARSLPVVAAAGALAAQAALHLTCSANDQATHLWVFHVGAVATAALAGWVVQARPYPSKARI